MNKVKSYVNRGMTIKEMIYNAAGQFPENNAFRIKENGEIKAETFEMLIRDIEALGTGLFAKGYKDSKIGIIGENSFPWFLCFLAAVCGANTAVPFDKGLTSEEVENCIERSHVNVMFYDAKHRELLKPAMEKYASQVDFICMYGEGNHLPEIMEEGAQRLAEGFDEYVKTQVKADDLAVFLFTSGTTSQSKIVMLSHGNIATNIRDMLEMEIFFPNDVNMAFLPFHHSFGLVGCLVFLSSGADNVFLDGLKYVQKNFAEYQVSVFVGVPLIVENLYNKVMKQIEKQGKTATVAKGLKISGALRKIGIDVRRKLFGEIIEKLGGSLRLIICGAAPLDKAVAKGLNDFGISTIQGYGLTETSPVLTAERPWNLCAGSVGTRMKSVDVRIDNADENGIGEIVVRGPNIMLGYYNQPEETAEAIKDGWFNTGDLGRIDAKGNLWITGRKKNVIVLKNGKNIFPEEIEELINKVPYVADSMIFTREKHNELVLWCQIVYDEEFLQENSIDEEGLAGIFAVDLEKINGILPKYKHVNHFILSSEPMIKTTTQKVKRAAQVDRINRNWENTPGYNVGSGTKIV